ncbi:hypothetical protein B0H17DRAFT_1145758 [Mycena rosella]|uniref:Aromatic compound dioxygenase n=1 Tax=Mycena rosella TaxID=1033263 RepID=A0AAD7G447_MYCRO|nr:hypothetical protein B0H17DRAFT_1145758 [Mycena rosella]
MRLSSFISLAVVCGLASAVPTVPVPRDCSAEVAKYNMARRAARGLSKRTFYANMLNVNGIPPVRSNLTSTTQTTCVLSPETPSEDYIANPPMRVDVTEDQPGVAFTVDVGVMNVETCHPLPALRWKFGRVRSLIDLSSPATHGNNIKYIANAQGNYGSTFLRGATETASNGIAEFQTIFPGYTSDSANHLNILVHTSSSESSGVAHFGRLYFTDPWTDIIGMYTDYNQNTHTRVKNANDPTFAAANKGGFNSVIEHSAIGINSFNLSESARREQGARAGAESARLRSNLSVAVTMFITALFLSARLEFSLSYQK